MDLEEIRKTYVVYENEHEEEEIEDDENHFENMDDPNFDLEYVAKVLSYKTQLAPSKMVAMINYRNPNDIR
jgi:hypothetical protein